MNIGAVLIRILTLFVILFLIFITILVLVLILVKVYFLSKFFSICSWSVSILILVLLFFVILSFIVFMFIVTHSNSPPLTVCVESKFLSHCLTKSFAVNFTQSGCVILPICPFPIDDLAKYIKASMPSCRSIHCP